MYPCAVRDQGPWSFVLGSWSVLWSKVLDAQIGPRTKDGLRTKNGLRTKDGPGTKNQAPRTTLIAALLIGTYGAVSAQRGAPPVPAPMPPVLRDYRPVTAERLKNPEDDNWLMIRRTYDGWGFSPLTQITPATVAR